MIMLFWFVLWGAAAEAAGFRSLLKSLSESLVKQSDEVSTKMGKLLNTLQNHTDEALAQVGKELHRPSATDEVLARLGKMGFPISESLRKSIHELDDVSRGALLGLVEQSGELIQRWGKLGRSFDDIAEAVQKCGPDVLYVCRQMQTDQALETVVRGTREIGPEFVSFARKADTKTVSRISEHLEELKRAWQDPELKPHLDELWKNPVKYFDELGQPTKHFEELIARIRKLPPETIPPRNRFRRGWKLVLGIPGAVWMFTRRVGAALAAALAPLLPLAWQGVVAFAIQLIVLVVLLFLVILMVAPWVLRVVNWLLWKLLPLLAKRQGTIGQWAKRKVEQPAPGKAAPKRYLPRRVSEGELKIGLLGLQRVGKTTFTVMLTKHLHRGIPGASLRPHRDAPDSTVLRQMEEEVTRCQPTKEERNIELDLTWPFFWENPDAPSPHDGGQAEGAERAGKLEMRLNLVDYPGEWANLPDKRKDLAAALKDVDGLFIIIDPTDLENGELKARLRAQQEAITNMFAADRLDLGKSFSRSVAILMTKRDAWTPELLRQLAQQHGKAEDPELQTMIQLAQQPSLSVEESTRLGEWLFKLLFPGVFDSLQTRLAESKRPKRSWYQRLIPWFSLDSRPQLRIFAVSQLGVQLGHQVVEYRQKVQQWQADGQKGPKPEIQLDLESVDPKQLDILQVFRWMFNSIPEGWMWTAQQLPRSVWWYFPWIWKWFSPGRVVAQTQSRFAGAPCVQRNAKVLRRRARWALGITLLVLGGLALLGSKFCRTWELNNFQAILQTAHTTVRASPDSASEMVGALERWKSSVWVATDYIPQAEVALNVLAIYQRMKPYEDQLGSQALSLEERRQAAQEWFSEYRNLPTPPESYLEEVRRLWEEVKRPLTNICRDLTAHLRREIDALYGGRQYEEAYRTINTIDTTLSLLPPPECAPYRQEIDNLRETVARGHADYVWSEANKKAEDALQQNKFKEALEEVVQRVQFPTQLSRQDKTDWERQKAERRQEIAQKWFTYLQPQIDILLKEGEPTKVYELLSEFERNVFWDDWPSRIEKFQRGIADRFVEISVQEATKQVAAGKFAEAETILDRCRQWIPQCAVPQAKEWYQSYSRVLRGQKKWSLLIEHLLAIPANLRDPEWWGKEWDEAWGTWANDFQDRLQTPGADLDSLERELTWAKTHQNTMAQTIKEKLSSWEQSLLLRQVEQAIQQAGQFVKEKKFAEAHDLLDRFGGKIQNLSPPLLHQWIEMKLSVFETEQRFLSAVQWASLLSPEIHNQLKKLSEWDWEKRRKKLIDRAVDLDWSHFESQLNENPKEAFHTLYQKANDITTPQEYQDDLRSRADRKIEEYFRSLEQKIAEALTNKRYTEAKKIFETLQDELGPWRQLEKLSSRLSAVEQKIAEAEVENELAQVESEIKKESASFEELYKRLQKVLQHPKLKDQQRAKTKNLQDDLLTRWEDHEYQTLRKFEANQQLENLETALKRYTDPKTPYYQKISNKRWNAARQLLKWFQQFEGVREYEITHIEGKGIPRNNIWPPWDLDFDFAFRVQVGQKEYIIPGTYEIEGEGTVALQEAIKLSWSPGTQVTIDIWDEQVGKKGHYVGKISISDKYSLIKICTSPQKIDASNTNWMGHNWSEAQIRWISPKITPPPTLPGE